MKNSARLSGSRAAVSWAAWVLVTSAVGCTQKNSASDAGMASDGGMPGDAAMAGSQTPDGAALPTSMNCAVGTGAYDPTTTPCATVDPGGETFDPTNPSPGSNSFYGYADPSIRKDPNSSYVYLAYSYAAPVYGSDTPSGAGATVADGLHVIELHLAYSQDSGATWTYAGKLFQADAYTNASPSTTFVANNVESHETVGLYPFVYNGQTMWIQAHQFYYVDGDGSMGLYGEDNVTNYTSLSAVLGSTPAALLTLGNSNPATQVPEAKLANSLSATTPGLTTTFDLSSVASATGNCDSWSQQTMFQQGGKLYLALQCTEGKAKAPDDNDLAFFVFSTTPGHDDPASPADATKWVWAFEGTIGTKAQAAALWKVESATTLAYDPNGTYSFFTEMELAMSSDGMHPLAIISPTNFAMGSQPVAQYGCRAIRVTSFSPPTFETEADGVTPMVRGSVTEQDLYSGANEGPGACAYEPNATHVGVVLVHKIEGPPHWTSLVESLAFP